MTSSLSDRRALARLVPTRRTLILAACAALLGAALSGCGQHGNPPLQLSGGTVGDVVNQPSDPTIQSKHFVVDASQGGLAPSLNITSMYWGRLVDVTDSNNVLQQKDIVIGEDIQSDSIDFKLTTNPVTSVTTVKILHPYLDPAPPGEPPGGTAYHTAFAKLELGTTSIDPKGASTADMPPFSLIPRNAAVVLVFNDLLDPNTISPSTVRVLTGNPPSVPFEPRILRDQNHGDLTDRNGDGILEFYTTRVIVSMTVSSLEAAASNPPLPVNAVGLPQSFTVNSPNVVVKIATQTDVFSGQTQLLMNLSGHPVSFSANAPNDPTSPTADIVRAARTGNSSDLHNGFLLDLDPPFVVGVQQVGLNAPNASDGLPIDPTNFRLAFATPACMSTTSPLKVGDVVRQPVAGVYAQITGMADPGAMQNIIIAGPAGSSSDPKYIYTIIVAPLAGPQTLMLGTGELSTVFDATLDQGHHACFVRFSSIAAPPNAKVGTESSVIVRFSKAMDPASLRPFDTQTVTRLAVPTSPKNYVVGEINPSSDITEFAFQPTLPFAHANNGQEPYFITLASGPNGPTDLAGSPLAVALPQVQFTIDPQAFAQSNSGLALRFNSLAENPNNNDPTNPPTLHDIRGQFLIDTAKGLLRPRAVTRFSAAADRTQPVPNLMPLSSGLEQTPLSGLGSKLQAIWRYCDVGLTLLDENQTNIDVENIDWAPKFGAVIGDHYSRFEIGLCHSFFLPDETVVNLPPPTVVFPASGLVSNYSTNYLDPTNDPLKIVHNRNLGYELNPADLFASEHGVPMVPYPLNRTVPPDQFKYYTWRDTSLLAIGGPNLTSPNGTSGAELLINLLATGGDPTLGGVPYASGFVPTIGLPLLMEFRCFPDSTALGLNTFDTNIALPANLGTRPNFRAFSTGGAQGSQIVIKDPDLQPTATGGFNPNSTPPGAVTSGVDDTFYLGQLDLVVRVSRAHTIWINSTSANPIYSPPVVEPRNEDQPLGTQIVLAYRGAGSVTAGAASDATKLDLYGEATDGSLITFQNGDASWKSSLSQLQGARWFQVRVTFVANSHTLLVPTLSALGFAFTL